MKAPLVGRLRRFALTLLVGTAGFVVGLAGTALPAAAAVGAPPPGFTLTWSDDFNGAAGTGVDMGNWLYDTGPGASFGTGEIETMSSSTANVYQDGTGHLVLKAIHTGTNPTLGWTSGRIETKAATFGAPPGGIVRMESMIQQPNVTTVDGLGYWPAFWMLGAPLRSGVGWPASGEIDILEDVNGSSLVYGTLHCGTASGGPCNETVGRGSGAYACAGCQTGYHDYAVEIDRSTSPEQIRWYLDGTNYFTLLATAVDATTWANAVDHPFFIIYDLAMGGGFPNGVCGCTTPTTATVSGASMNIDWVAVFNKAPPPATYHALTPSRILDSRDGTGGLSGAFSSHVARTFTVTGQGGVPPGATAVTGNLTVTQQTSGGFLYIGPDAQNNPTSSTLNFPLGDDRANAVTVALSGTGTLSVTYAAATLGPTAHVIFDVTGYFTSDMSGATYHALTPARILDSRDGTGGLGIFSSHVAQTFTVTGHGGVAANAIAVTGNLTVTQQTSGGFLFIGPVAMDNPTSSTLNFPVGDDRANAVTVALSGTGTLSITYAAQTLGPTAHVIFDVTGYFTPDASGALFVPLTPARILDSRDHTGGVGIFSSHVAQTFTVTGQGGVAANAIAVTGNLTVTQQSSGGFLYIGPNSIDNPTSSTLNFPLGDDRANAVTVALGAGGTLSVTYAAPVLGPTAQVIFDVTGYFMLAA